MENENVTNKIIVCVEGQDWTTNYDTYNLNFDSSEEEILERIAPVIEENFNVSLRNGSNWLYKTRKAVNSQNIYIIPNSTAGK